MSVNMPPNLSTDMQAQIARAINSNPDVAAARQVKPGPIATEEDSVQRTSNKRAKVRREDPPAKVESDIAQRRAAADKAFEAAAAKFIDQEVEAEDDRADDILRNSRVDKRGALLDDDEEDSDTEEVQVRDSSGKFTGKKTRVIREDVDDDDVEEQSDDGEEESDSDSSDKRMSHEKALRILRLDGFKSKALEKLSPEEVVELASHRASVRSDVDAKLSELAELKKAATTKNEQAPSAQQQKPATGAQTSKFNYADVATLMKNSFDDQTVKGLEAPLTHIVKHLEKQLSEKAEAFAPVMHMVMQMRIENSRAKLERKHPQLADDAVFDRVMNKAGKLDATAYNGDVEAMLSDAASIVLSSKAYSGKTSDAARVARVRAQPTVTSRRNVGSEHRSRHDAFGDAVVAMEQGETDLAKQIVRNSR